MDLGYFFLRCGYIPFMNIIYETCMSFELRLPERLKDPRS